MDRTITLSPSLRVSTADLLAVFCSLVMLIAFLFMPWLEISGIGGVSGLKLLQEVQPNVQNDVSSQFLILFVSIESLVVALWATISARARAISPALLVSSGLLGIVYFGFYFLQSSRLAVDDLQPQGIGFALAVAANAGLILQAFIPREIDETFPHDRWFLLSLLLVNFGIGISGYLSYVKIADVAVQCVTSAGFNCEIVQNSAYSRLAGVPVAWLGLGTYIAIGVLLVVEVSVHHYMFRREQLVVSGSRIDRWLDTGLAEFFYQNGITLLFGLVLFSFVFSLYLVYVQGFILEAWCQWCLLHELTMTILFAVTSARLYHTLFSIPVEPPVG